MNQRKSKKNKPKKVHVQPPPLHELELTHSTTLRFEITSAGTGQIAWNDILDCLLVATTATQGFQLFKRARIRYVEMWSVQAVGTTNTVSVSFNGTTAGSIGDQCTHSDTALGTTRAAHVRAKPRSLSQAAQFQPSSAAIAFSITFTDYTIIDVGVTFRGSNFQDVATVNAAQAALVGATAGAVYWRGLDGAAIATTGFLPQGVPPI
jgi:hypothetical protein